MSLAVTSTASLAHANRHEAVSSAITPATASLPGSEFPISNFERVNSVLLRGAVPTDKGIEALNAAGVKTIVNLRKRGDGTSTEERKVKQLGMQYVSIPLGFTTPEPEAITKILRIINDKNMQPVFIHCRQGADRTGMVVAINRMLVDNWQFEDAYAEMRKHHFKPFLLGMKETVRTCGLQGEFLSAVGIDRTKLTGTEHSKTQALESRTEASGP